MPAATPTTRPSTTAAGAFWPALALTAVSTFVAMVAYSAPLGDAPVLARALGASTAERIWILTSMSFGLAVSLLTAGALADRSGRRRVFLAGATIFALGSVVCALAGSPIAFIVGRLVEGLGATGMIATGLGLVHAVTTTAAQRSTSASWWGASMGLGIALGPVIAGLFDIVDWWPATYWLLAAAGVAAAVTARRCYVETKPIHRRLDPIGATSLTVGLATLLIALIEVRQSGGLAAVVWFVVAAAALAGFAVSQWRGRSPMIEPELLRRKDLLAATASSTITGASVISLMSFACTFFVTGLGLTSLAAGALLTAWSATSAVSAIASRRLAARMTGTMQLSIGLAVTGVGMLLLGWLSTGDSPIRLLPGLLIAGMSTGLVNSGLARQSVATVPVERAALGTGINNTTRYIGASVGVTLVSVVAAAGAAGSSTAAQFAGWDRVVPMTGAFAILGALLVLALRNRQRPQNPKH